MTSTPPGGSRQADPRDPQPDCRRCSGFFITHQREFPYGCRPMGFRSARLPCVVVLQAAGIPCLHFSPKGAGKPGTG